MRALLQIEGKYLIKIMYVRQRGGWDEPIQRERREDLSHLSE